MLDTLLKLGFKASLESKRVEPLYDDRSGGYLYTIDLTEKIKVVFDNEDKLTLGLKDPILSCGKLIYVLEDNGKYVVGMEYNPTTNSFIK